MGPVIPSLNTEQGKQIGEDLSMWASGQDTSAEEILAEVDDALGKTPVPKEIDVTGERIAALGRSVLQSIVKYVVTSLGKMFSSIAGFIMKAILFLAVLGALLPGWPGLVKLLKRLSPLQDELDQVYVGWFELVSGSVMTAVLVSMVAQGATMTFFLGIAGIPYLFFWCILCTVLAGMPIGEGIITCPLGIILILTGHPAGAGHYPGLCPRHDQRCSDCSGDDRAQRSNR